MTTVERILPTDEARDLLGLATEIADGELRPRAATSRTAPSSPASVLRTLGRAGLLGLPYPEEYGGGGQPYEVYLQVLEDPGRPLAGRRRGGQRAHPGLLPAGRVRHRAAAQALLPDMLGGELLGAYCLSEPQGGSDAAALTTRARARRRRLRGHRHQGLDHPRRPGRLLQRLLPHRRARRAAASPACSPTPTRPASLPQAPERTMGLRAVAVGADRLRRRPGRRPTGCSASEGGGFRIAHARPGRAAGSASPPARSAWPRPRWTTPSAYAREREQFGRPIIEFQGVGFMLADMATQVSAARALTWPRPGCATPAGRTRLEAAKAKLFATDTAMRVTTDAVQVLGGYGYVADHPVERYMREAKVLQIVEGTNQIQRAGDRPLAACADTDRDGPP